MRNYGSNSNWKFGQCNYCNVCYVTTQCLSLTLVVHFQDIVLAKHGWIFARIMPKGKTTVQQRDSFSTGLEINQPY